MNCTSLVLFFLFYEPMLLLLLLFLGQAVLPMREQVCSWYGSSWCLVHSWVWRKQARSITWLGWFKRWGHVPVSVFANATYSVFSPPTSVDWVIHEKPLALLSHLAFSLSLMMARCLLWSPTVFCPWTVQLESSRVAGVRVKHGAKLKRCSHEGCTWTYTSICNALRMKNGYLGLHL